MDQEIQIAEVSEQEAAAIARLEQIIFSDAWSVQAIQETWRQPCALVAGAKLGRSLVGYGILYYVAGEGEIVRIAVDASVRRQGVAGRLLKHLEDSCKKKGGVRLLLDVRESNSAAIAFYKKYGFTEDGIRKKFYTNPAENAILMSRRINKTDL